MKKNLFALIAVAALVCACNTKEVFVPEDDIQGIPFVATVQLDDAFSKAVIESGGDIVTNFIAGEEIALIYEVSSTPYKTDANIASVDGTGKATISATLQAGVTDGTSVTLIYPASAADGTTGNVLSTVLSAQDGALSTSRDIRKGTGTISVDGTASLSGGATLDAQYAICEFTVKDVDGSNSLSVSSFVVKDASNNVITTVTPASPTSTLYVSLPTTSALLWFEAVASGKPYVAKGTAALTAGNYYTPTVKMATIFNVIGANGKFYKDMSAAVAASTTASAIIAYLGDDTAETDYKHGLAIAMRNAGGSTKRWKAENDPATTDNGAGHQFTSYSAAIAAKESGLTLSSMSDRDNESLFPAFYHARNNTITVEAGMSSSKPSSGTSDWFLASVFQWNQIMIGMTGISSGLTTTMTSGFGANSILSELTAAGSSNSRLFANYGTSYQQTSTEYDASNQWVYQADASTGKGALANASKTAYAYVRAVLAF